MAKLRWTLALLALGIGLPAVLIVLRATEALDLENATRHETVAERVFDEMERSLSDFLVREEARPASDYALVALVQESTSPTSPFPARFANADEPFLLGWFVLPATGDARTLAAEPLDRVRISAAMRSVFNAKHAAHDARQAENKDSIFDADSHAPEPGRTSSVGRSRLDQESLAKLQADSPEESSTYEVLQNLNRAGSLRSERQSKSLMKRGDKQESGSPAVLPSATAREDLRMLDSSGSSDDAGVRLAEAPRDLAHAADPVREESRKESDSPVVDPLVGRVTPAGDIVLTRSAWQGTRVERQGLVLDRGRLVAWLANRILGDTGLSERASLEFAPFPSPGEEAEYRYVHRFAEPFDGLIARLDLEPLPSLGASRSIHALALLLAIALVIGLLAVDRMTRVVVDYAERRSDFVAAVSHELRTPLTAIRMYGEMLRDGLVASESKRAEYYATITDESERLSRLIDNVLEFSRLEQNRRESNLVVGDLPETVRAASEKLKAHAEREGFELALELPATLPRVRHDRDAVTQIVFNLVDNALKYARSAELKTIEIKLSASGHGIELRVRDFGPGVRQDQLDRIFEPFYRIGEELTRTAEGTGIGLALVRELAKAMGGSAKAIQPKGGGLEIVISIPAAA